MEFLRKKVFTALTAGELRVGDKVIVADNMADLKILVEADAKPTIIELIQDETNTNRFTCQCYGSYKTYDSSLAYIVERAENCSKCEHLGESCISNKDDKITYCSDYKPKPEQEAEKHYRQFRDTDELIAHWLDKGGKWQKRPLTMPLIWVRNKSDRKAWLITEFDKRILDYLFTNCEFLDGSPCGVEE